MKRRRLPATIGLLATLLVTGAGGAVAQADNYPVRPVKIIVSSGAGGAIDVLARVVADHLSRIWGQQVLVVNHPGGGTAIGVRAAATSVPDGYTLFYALTASFVALPVLQPDLPFDVARDFVPIGLIGEQPMIIAVDPALGVNTLEELIALSKKRPGGLTCAVPTSGSLPHVTGEWFRRRAGADLTFIHYPGTAQSVLDVIGGRVSMLIEALPALAGAIAGGRLKPIAVASRERLPSLGDVPTVTETVMGFVAMGWFALMAPPGTSPEITSKISEDLRKILELPELKRKFTELGTIARPMSAAELTGFIRSEQELWSPVVRALEAQRK